MENTDPLAELAPLRLPEAIGWWPLAPGWWLLIVLVLLLLGTGLWLYRKQRHASAYRRQALSQLDELQNAHKDDPNAFAQELNALLKATALRSYPSAQCAGLSGANWLVFLNRALPDQDAPTSLATAPYDAAAQIDRQTLLHYAKAWIKKHRSALT